MFKGTNREGITVEETDKGAILHIDQSVKEPVILKADCGLGIMEPCYSIQKDGNNMIVKSISNRKYFGEGFSLTVKCKCGEMLEVDVKDKRKQCWGVCSCGAIFMNPFYVDPVSESWQRSAERGEAYM